VTTENDGWHIHAALQYGTKAMQFEATTFSQGAREPPFCAKHDGKESSIWRSIMENQTQVEPSPGLIIQRRRILWLPVMATAAMVRSNPEGQDAAKRSETDTASATGPLAWNEFLQYALPQAAKLHRDASPQGQDAYLHWLALMAARLQLATIPDTKLGRFRQLDPAVYFGPSYRGKPFFIVEWRLEPGAILPPHCHPNASVCTVGISGEARIRNFEIVGQAPEFASRQAFRVRETHNEILSQGRSNTLSAVRDNIHMLEAGREGARGMDISTYHGPDIGFSFLELEYKPVDAEQRLFEAVWKQ
jgi:hypothetical protein